MTPGVVHQNLSHQPRSDGDKMHPIFDGDRASVEEAQERSDLIAFLRAL